MLVGWFYGVNGSENFSGSMAGFGFVQVGVVSEIQLFRVWIERSVASLYCLSVFGLPFFFLHAIWIFFIFNRFSLVAERGIGVYVWK